MSSGAHRVDEVVRGPIKSKTVFPALVLHFIERRPDHGYGLMQRINDVCGDLVAVNTNTIYPLLRRLEERGFLTAAWEHPTKRSRRVYAITEEGERRLQRIKGAMLPYLDDLRRHRAAARRVIRKALRDFWWAGKQAIQLDLATTGDGLEGA